MQSDIGSESLPIRERYERIRTSGCGRPAEPTQVRWGSVRGWSIRTSSLFVLLMGLIVDATEAYEPIVASIEKDSAWTGEAVPLIITLYSPGPFSGTASFDFPELPKTAVMRVGNPVVGSEELDGDSVFTQRHEFSLYTQQTGTFVLPAFEVRFQGKPSFVGEPEPITGSTTELEFVSNRPPGTESLGVVIATSDLESEQTWSPTDAKSLTAGDVIERRITRRVTGTTAMMLTPADIMTPDGVRTYLSDPIVEDKSDRGTLTAVRVESIKYQFERAGTFELPELAFPWWDVDANKIQTTTLAGQTYKVVALDAQGAAVQSTKSPSETGYRVLVILGCLVLGIGSLLFLYRPVLRRIENMRAARDTSESAAAKRVIKSCQANDAQATYDAVMAWKRMVGHQPSSPTSTNLFDQAWGQLSKHLFAGDLSSQPWSGKLLQQAFSEARRTRSVDERKQGKRSLPALNP